MKSRKQRPGQPVAMPRFVDSHALRPEFERALSAFCRWSLVRNDEGRYVDENTRYAWSEYLRINALKGVATQA